MDLANHPFRNLEESASRIYTPVIQVNAGENPTMENPTPYNVTKIHVTIPLENSGIKPKDIYSKKIYVGWINPSDNLRHFLLQPKYFVLHETMEPVRVCECSFFWLNVNAAEKNEWVRIVDFASAPEKMDNLDDEAGETNPCDNDNTACLVNMLFDYYIYDGMPVHLAANGYDQDCLDDDDDPLFGMYLFNLDRFSDCYGVSLDHDFHVPNPIPILNSFFPGFSFENGDNDKFSSSKQTLNGSNNYGIGNQIMAGVSQDQE